jgi:hypothetical protein
VRIVVPAPRFANTNPSILRKMKKLLQKIAIASRVSKCHDDKLVGDRSVPVARGGQPIHTGLVARVFPHGSQG